MITFNSEKKTYGFILLGHSVSASGLPTLEAARKALAKEKRYYYSNLLKTA